MHKFVAALALLIPVLMQPAQARSSADRVRDSCKRQAQDMHDDQRREFLPRCVQKGNIRQNARHQHRAVSCTDAARNRDGDDRRDFLRKCRERYR